jgi:hypothetical protein
VGGRKSNDNEPVGYACACGSQLAGELFAFDVIVTSLPFVMAHEPSSVRYCIGVLYGIDICHRSHVGDDVGVHPIANLGSVSATRSGSTCAGRVPT